MKKDLDTITGAIWDTKQFEEEPNPMKILNEVISKTKQKEIRPPKEKKPQATQKPRSVLSGSEKRETPKNPSIWSDIY